MVRSSLCSSSEFRVRRSLSSAIEEKKSSIGLTATAKPR